MSREVGYQLLAKLQELLDRLAQFQTVEDPTRFIDFDLAVERIISLLVEIANDLLSHLFVHTHQAVPTTYYEMFGKAGEIGWITKDLAARLQQAGKMRNILIHAYGKVDPEIVHQSIPHALRDFQLFAAHIRPQVDKLAPMK